MYVRQTMTTMISWTCIMIESQVQMDLSFQSVEEQKFLHLVVLAKAVCERSGCRRSEKRQASFVGHMHQTFTVGFLVGSKQS